MRRRHGAAAGNGKRGGLWLRGGWNAAWRMWAQSNGWRVFWSQLRERCKKIRTASIKWKGKWSRRRMRAL